MEERRAPSARRAVAGTVAAVCAVGAAAAFWPFLRHGLRGSAPFVAASDRLVAKQVEAVASMNPRAKGRMVDLGSGNGALVVVRTDFFCFCFLMDGDKAFAKRFPEMECIGVDNNVWLTLVSRWRARGLKNARFRKRNLFKFDVSSCDVVLACLVPSMMAQLGAMLRNAAKPEAIIVCARFPLENGIKAEITLPGGPVDGVWIYRGRQMVIQSASNSSSVPLKN